MQSFVLFLIYPSQTIEFQNKFAVYGPFTTSCYYNPIAAKL